MKTVTILTCDRVPNYLERTVASIPIEYNLQYIAQGNIIQPREGKLISVDKKYKDDKTRHRDNQYNYSTALKETIDGLIIEDDVIFSKLFDKELQRVKKDLNTDKYAVALYSCYNWSKYKTDSSIVKYPVQNYYGAQAMLYDLDTARRFGEYLGNNIGKEPFDIALKTFITTVASDVTLYASKYSLVQHIGVISTGLGSRHFTTNFIDYKKPY